MRLKYLVFLSFALNACSGSQETKKSSTKAEAFLETLKEEPLLHRLEWGGFIRAERERIMAAEIDGSLSKIIINSGDYARQGQAIMQVVPKGSGLEYNVHTVRAPFNGIVSTIHKQRGSVVRVGEPLVTISDPNVYEVEVQIAGDDLRFVGPGAPVEIFVPTQNGPAIPGVFVSVGQSIDPSLGTVPGLVRLSCSKERKSIFCIDGLPLGTFVAVTSYAKSREVLKVSKKALHDQNRAVWVVSKDGEINAVRVDVDINVPGDFAVVRSGIKAGEKVILTLSKPAKLGERVDVAGIDGKPVNAAANEKDPKAPSKKKS